MAGCREIARIRSTFIAKPVVWEVPTVVHQKCGRAHAGIANSGNSSSKVSTVYRTAAQVARFFFQSRTSFSLFNFWRSSWGPSLHHALRILSGRHLRGPAIVLLDNSLIHKGAPVEQLLRQHRRLRLEYFPSYALQLNPDEGVWSLAKRELANSCPNDVDELMEDILGSISGIRESQQKLRGCIAQSELTISLR
jgi:transposase